MKNFVVILVLSAMALSGCAFSGTKPLESLYYPAGKEANGKNLIVFLRGIGGSHRSFEEYGFIDAVQKSNIPSDMVAVNAHFGYYRERTLNQRLKTDILEPARAKGYEKIWLAGVSMGGLGAIIYTREYPKDISGIILISPFLGYEKINKEIAAAGGLSKWQPGEFTEEDWERLTWAWLKFTGTNDDLSCPLYLGYGASDEYALAQTILAQALPQNRVKILEGGHTPATFQRIWDVMVRDVLTTKLTD